MVLAIDLNHRQLDLDSLICCLSAFLQLYERRPVEIVGATDGASEPRRHAGDEILPQIVDDGHLIEPLEG